MMDAAVISDAKAREVLLGELAPLDEAAVTPYLGEYAYPAPGSMTLRLREGKLIFTTAGMHSALLPLTAGAGDATEYVFGYPPWASTPPAHKVTLRMDSDQPEVTISIPGDGDEGLNTYVYTRLAATGATPVP